MSTVKAVGFSFVSPEVLIVHYHYNKTERLHLYPSEIPEAFDLSEKRKKHIVLLKSAEKRNDLAQYANQIHRMLVFGKPDDLMDLKIPIVDAVVQGGKADIRPTMTPQLLSAWIDEDAVDLDLQEKVSKSWVTPAPAEETKKPKTKRTLRAILKKMVSYVDEQYRNDFKMAVYQRIVDDISNEDFKAVCKKMAKFGVPKSAVKSIYRWVEGIEGDGAFLGKAVDRYFNPRDEEEIDLRKIADEYAVEVDDIKLVINALEEIDADLG